MKCAGIQTEQASYPRTKRCHWLGVTPSGVDAWRQRPESTYAREDRRLTVRVQASFAERTQRYGRPRMHADLIAHDEQVSRTRVIRVMPDNGLTARTRTRCTWTTMRDHDQPVAVNLLDRPLEAAAPNQRWVGDTTECVIGSSGTRSLAVVLDLFSRCVVGWAVRAVHDRHLPITALEMARQRRCPEIGLVHHSDQGCTSARADDQALLEARGIVYSMSRRGHCHDHAVMEAASPPGRVSSPIGSTRTETRRWSRSTPSTCSITTDAGTRRLARSVQRPWNDARTTRVWSLWITATDAVSHRLHTQYLVQ